MTEKELVLTDPDFILIKRFDNSMKKLMERYPEGVPDKIIAQALGVDERRLGTMYDAIVEKLRKYMLPGE